MTTRRGCWRARGADVFRRLGQAGGALLQDKIKEGARYDINLVKGGAGDLGLSDRLVERRRASQFP